MLIFFSPVSEKQLLADSVIIQILKNYCKNLLPQPDEIITARLDVIAHR